MPAPVYLDHSATTPVRPEVLDAMQPFFGPRFGNPSSIHRWGREARVALDEARERVAHCLGANADEICFTSGGTEADNLAVLGAWRSARTRGRTAVVTTPVEHKAVIEAAHTAVHEGAEERLVGMTPDGVADRASFDAAVRDDVAVASVMWVNNEMGAVQPVPEFAAMAAGRGVIFHTDAVQAFGKLAVDVARVPVALLSISGHKIGAPKGSGALFIRRGTPIEPLFHGGSQDRGRRPGTENVAYAVGLASAAELAIDERDAEAKRLAALRDRLQEMLEARLPGLVVHARNAPRAPHILNVSVSGTESESLLMALDLEGIACSGGSACQSGAGSPSYVLTAMGVEPGLAGAAVRMSLGVLSDDAAIERVAEVFPRVVAKARGASVNAA